MLQSVFTFVSYTYKEKNRILVSVVFTFVSYTYKEKNRILVPVVQGTSYIPHRSAGAWYCRSYKLEAPQNYMS